MCLCMTSRSSTVRVWCVYLPFAHQQIYLFFRGIKSNSNVHKLRNEFSKLISKLYGLRRSVLSWLLFISVLNLLPFSQKRARP